MGLSDTRRVEVFSLVVYLVLSVDFLVSVAVFLRNLSSLL